MKQSDIDELLHKIFNDKEEKCSDEELLMKIKQRKVSIDMENVKNT